MKTIFECGCANCRIKKIIWNQRNKGTWMKPVFVSTHNAHTTKKYEIDVQDLINFGIRKDIDGAGFEERK